MLKMIQIPILLQVSVSGYCHGSMISSLFLWFLLMILVKGMVYKNLPSSGLTSLVVFWPPNGMQYRKNTSFQNVVKEMEQNYVLASTRDFWHFIVNYGDSAIQHKKRLIKYINPMSYRLLIWSLWRNMNRYK